MQEIKRHSPAEFRYRLAETLRKERIAQGYATIYDLAEASGMPVHLLMSIENGNITHLGELFHLARFYNKRIKISFI